MSLKYSSTTAVYLIWSDAMNLIRKLAKDENYNEVHSIRPYKIV